jgi:hypothetical protein
MMRAMFTSSALAALLLLTACDQPADQRAQNGSSQLQPDQSTTPTSPTAEPGAMDQTGPMQTAGVPLSDVTDPEKTLTNVSVKDNKGDAVGEVKSVSLDAGGKVQAVNVGIGSRTVALQATGLTYMQAENTIVSPQSKDEIQKIK